jgi:uncharacterized membrane protein YjfL (UPF0719 family)
MEELMSILSHGLYGAAYLAIAYTLLYCNKLLSDWYSHSLGFDPDDEIEEKSNLAVGLRRAGLYLGIMLGMYGVISGPSRGFLLDLFDIATYGAIVSVFFVFARAINDMIVLGTAKNTEQVKNGNVGIALVECGALIATGIIAMSSMSGVGGNYLTAMAFFAIGQLLLLAVIVVYEWVTPWHVRKELHRGNPAAGLKVGSLMVAVAIATSGAISVDFLSWTKNLTILAVDGALAVFFMMLPLILHRSVLPQRN